MATNGDAQQLEQVERAITGLRAVTAPAAVNVADDIMGLAEAQAAQAEAQAAQAEAVAKYVLEHAQFVHAACLGHAEKTRADAQKTRADARHFAANLLAAERRKMAELEKIMGKTGP